MNPRRPPRVWSRNSRRFPEADDACARKELFDESCLQVVALGLPPPRRPAAAAEEVAGLPLHVQRLDPKTVRVWVGDHVSTTNVVAFSTAKGIVVVDTTGDPEGRPRAAPGDRPRARPLRLHHADQHARARRPHRRELRLRRHRHRGPRALRRRDAAGPGRPDADPRVAGDTASPSSRRDLAKQPAGASRGPEEERESWSFARLNHEVLKANAKPVVPTKTFADRMTLDMGDTTFELSYIGGLHSASDIAVFVPSQRDPDDGRHDGRPLAHRHAGLPRLVRRARGGPPRLPAPPRERTPPARTEGPDPHDPPRPLERRALLRRLRGAAQVRRDALGRGPARSRRRDGHSRRSTRRSRSSKRFPDLAKSPGFNAAQPRDDRLRDLEGRDEPGLRNGAAELYALVEAGSSGGRDSRPSSPTATRRRRSTTSSSGRSTAAATSSSRKRRPRGRDAVPDQRGALPRVVERLGQPRRGAPGGRRRGRGEADLREVGGAETPRTGTGRRRWRASGPGQRRSKHLDGRSGSSLLQDACRGGPDFLCSVHPNTMLLDRRHRALYAAFDRFPTCKGASTHIARFAPALFEEFGGGLLYVVGDESLPAHQLEGDVEIVRFSLPVPNLLERAVAFGGHLARLLEEADDDLEICHFRDPWSGVPILERPRRYARSSRSTRSRRSSFPTPSPRSPRGRSGRSARPSASVSRPRTGSSRRPGRRATSSWARASRRRRSTSCRTAPIPCRPSPDPSRPRTST